MKIVFNVNEILPQVTQVCSVVNPKAPMQILSDIVLKTYRTSDGELCLMTTGSDNETFVSIKSSIMSDSEDGFCVAINAKDFLSTLRNLSGQTITLETDESAHTIKGTYLNGHFSMPYEDVDAYPTPVVSEEDKKEILVDAQRLSMAISCVEHAIANDEIRPVLNGEHFDFTEDGMVTVATDGLILSRYIDKTIHFDNSGNGDVGFTLPTKPTHIIPLLLAKRNDDVKLVFNDRNVILSCNDFRIVARVHEGKYANYNSVIPNDFKHKVILKNDDLKGALSRVMPMGDSSSELVALTFDNDWVIVNTEDVDFSKSASEKVKCDYKDEKFAIGFKGSALMSVINKIQDDVVFNLNEPYLSAMVEPKSKGADTDYITIIMPMKLND